MKAEKQLAQKVSEGWSRKEQGLGMEDLLPGWRTPEENASHGLPDTSDHVENGTAGFHKSAGVSGEN